MSYFQIDPREERFGSGALADHHMRKDAGVYEHGGAFVGVDERGRMCFARGQAAMLLVGAARSGKNSLIVPWLIDGHISDHVICMDWKNQLGEIAGLQVHQNRRIVNFDPRGRSYQGSARINPGSHLRGDSETLIVDSLSFGANWLPTSGDPRANYFERLGQLKTAAASVILARDYGVLELPTLADVMIDVGGLSDEWLMTEYAMLHGPEKWIRDLAADIQRARESDDTSGGFRGVKNEIINSFRPLVDPQLRAVLSHPTFCFSELTDPSAPPYLVDIQEEPRYAETSSPVIRALYASARYYKEKAPVNQTRPQFWILDEVGNISGGWPMAVDLATASAGYGIRAAFIVQSSAQLDRLGKDAAKIIPNSCGTQIYMGVREYNEAALVSKMIGTATLEYDDHHRQAEARHRARQAYIGSFMRGDDPFSAAMEASHYNSIASLPSKQGRPVRTPDEIMNEPEGTAFVFMPGQIARPMYQRVPRYWQRRDLAGRYLGDPFHSPPGQVEIATRRGQQMRRIIEGAVPPAYQEWPQYQFSSFRYVEGFRP